MSPNSFLYHLLRGPLACAAVLATHAVGYAQGNSGQTPAANNSAARTTTPGESVAANSTPPTTFRPALLTAGVGRAPTIVAQRDLPSLRSDQQTTVLQMQADAKARVKSGDVAGAVQKLSLVNVAKADTADWHLETTQHCMQLAGQLSREGNIRDSKAVVTESLKQLDQAVALAKAATDTSGQARAHASAAVIHERYRGDPVASIASYQAALLANPDDTGAKEAVERLQRSYENRLARAKKAKK